MAKYKDWLTPDSLLIVKGWARDGLTDKEIAENMNVSMSTLTEWKRKYSALSAAIKKGRRPIIVKVEDTFFKKKLRGYTVKETTTEKTIHRNADGDITGSTEHFRENERYIPPDTTAIIFYLKCRKPEIYNDKINVNVENSGNGQLVDLINGLKENVYTEAIATNEIMADEPTKEN